MCQAVVGNALVRLSLPSLSPPSGLHSNALLPEACLDIAFGPCFLLPLLSVHPVADFLYLPYS